MCSMMPPMSTCVPSRHGVHVHLDGMVEEAVQQHGGLVGDPHGVAHVAVELLLVVDDLHGPPAQHVGRPDHQGIADGGRELHRLAFAAGSAVRGLAQPSLLIMR